MIPKLFVPAPMPDPQPCAPTVEQVVTVYLLEKEVAHKSGIYGEKAFDRLKRRLASFVAKFGSEPVKKLSKFHLTAWVADHPEWKSSHTKTDACGCVVSCFRWAVDQGFISHCPFKRPKGLWPALLPRVAIRPDEYLAMMAAAKRRGYQRARLSFRVALFFLWDTGCRTCEMRNLTFDQVDFQTGVASLAEHKTLHTTGEARLIILGPVAMRLVRWIHRRRGRPSSGLIFPNSLGRSWDAPGFAKYFHKVAVAAGVRLKLSPYSLRHGFTVQGIENGVNERQLADLLGHASTRYVAWYGKSSRRRADYLRGVLDQVHGRKK